MATEEELDEAVEYWQTKYDPSRCLNVLGASPVFMTRVPTTPAELARVNKPVLIIHGDGSEVHPVYCATDLQEQLVNVPRGGAQLHIIERGSDNLNIPIRFARRVNKYTSAFLSSLPSHRSRASSSATSASSSGGGGGGVWTSRIGVSPLVPGATLRGCTVNEADMRRALALQSHLAGDPAIAQKDPLDPWSFSRKPLEAQVLIQTLIIPQWQEVERSGKTFLDEDGRPLRKWSERHNDLLFRRKSGRRPGSAAGSTSSTDTVTRSHVQVPYVTKSIVSSTEPLS